jgi:hypothetical protein
MDENFHLPPPKLPSFREDICVLYLSASSLHAENDI